ncbi:hypothetical protein Trydic_g19903 [Trypoxylus dichotomus]
MTAEVSHQHLFNFYGEGIKKKTSTSPPILLYRNWIPSEHDYSSHRNDMRPRRSSMQLRAKHQAQQLQRNPSMRLHWTWTAGHLLSVPPAQRKRTSATVKYRHGALKVCRSRMDNIQLSRHLIRPASFRVWVIACSNGSATMNDH